MRHALLVALAATAPSLELRGQPRGRLSVAVDANAAVMFATSHAITGYVTNKKKDRLKRWGYPGGSGNRIGGNLELMYETRSQHGYLISIGRHDGWYNQRQAPHLDVGNTLGFTDYTSTDVIIGMRNYFRPPSAHVRAFLDLGVGMERLRAPAKTVSVHPDPRGRMITTSGPTGRLRLGSQVQLKHNLALDVTFAGSYSRFSTYRVNDDPEMGDATRMSSVSFRPGLRLMTW